ncbi:hypothetical protein [Thermaerobacter subterraneus]|uniref:Uncharacterized protein n=1 Tax=Thermaerobacter subterraneus DSM 13965 TaxID=867903 RepID=K6PZ45_9FIRM|nr:hypothetical protein [Thermaerobacter subterraneus]EKP94008.1 hypothetical protein ThesuDRAFT_01732 [Thermaerobacter subterraneus DSM 13965]
MRGLRVVAVPIRVEPVPHLEAARERLLSALLAGYRKLAAAGAVRPHPPRLLHGASTSPPAGAQEPEGREPQPGDAAGPAPVPGGGGTGGPGIRRPARAAWARPRRPAPAFPAPPGMPLLPVRPEPPPGGRAPAPRERGSVRRRGRRDWWSFPAWAGFCP